MVACEIIALNVNCTTMFKIIYKNISFPRADLARKYIMSFITKEAERGHYYVITAQIVGQVSVQCVIQVQVIQGTN